MSPDLTKNKKIRKILKISLNENIIIDNRFNNMSFK